MALRRTLPAFLAFVLVTAAAACREEETPPPVDPLPAAAITAEDEGPLTGAYLDVPTAEGAVRGRLHGGVWNWRGVPFAADPVGELRWRAPRPAPVRTGVLDAATWGPDCPQSGSGGSPFANVPLKEECLTLNVWSANVATAKPVMVWIHGGGFS